MCMVMVRKKKSRKKTLTDLGPDELLTPRGVAKMRGCSDQAVRNAIKAQELEAVPLWGPDATVSAYAVRLEDAEAWEPRRPGRPVD